ncbi:MAG: phosphoglycolate phosphatase [Gammaproteobacteria bacterium]|nr:phosphoglycolate phosphatase [Gammaproteobacteria bacterium]
MKSDKNDIELPPAVLFDLDGTLIDSVPDIAYSCNRVLKQQGKEELSLPEVRSMIGNGIPKLVERAFAARGCALAVEELKARAHDMVAIYEQNITNKTCPMPGAVALVDELVSRQCLIAVVTNKPTHLSQILVDHFGWHSAIPVVVGGDLLPKRKPDPDMLIHACRLLSVNVSSAIMVGDSPVDVDSARAAGIRSIVVRGGYTNVAAEDMGANIIVENLCELQQILI